MLVVGGRRGFRGGCPDTSERKKGLTMLVDIEKMNVDEVRNALILSKELLRQLADRSPDTFCFESYTGAYLSVCDAISTLNRVQVISADDDIDEEA